MISDEELMSLDARGLIPGPDENEEAFVKRVQMVEEFFQSPQRFLEDSPFSFENPVAKHRTLWSRLQLKEIFNIEPDWLPCYFDNEKLPFWQPAATWVLETKDQTTRLALIQLRKALKKGTYLRIYSQAEVLAHEGAHAARMAFDEPVSEEIFSYLTSTSRIRRVWGPIMRSAFQAKLFMIFIMATMVSSVIFLLFPNPFFAFLLPLCLSCTIGWFSIGVLRLFFTRLRFNRAHQKLFKLLKNKKMTRSVLFRLTDREIKEFSRMSPKEIEAYVEEKRTSSLRWRLIHLAYFSLKKSVS